MITNLCSVFTVLDCGCPVHAGVEVKFDKKWNFFDRSQQFIDFHKKLNSTIMPTRRWKSNSTFCRSAPVSTLTAVWMGLNRVEMTTNFQDGQVHRVACSFAKELCTNSSLISEVYVSQLTLW